MIFFAVIPLFIVTIRASDLCPNDIVVTLKQENPAPRPKGDVKLTCVIRGVTSSDVEYYRWLLEEFSSPLYMYSEQYKFDGIKPEHKNLVTRVKHTLSKTGIESNITLGLDINNENTYRCEFKIYPNKVCSKLIGIKFQEPRVSINFTTQNPTQEKSSVNATLADAICKVDVSAGKPKFTISYNGNGSSTFQIVNEEHRLESYGYYQNGSYMTTLVIPYTGEIVCTVKDGLGIYTARKTINVTATWASIPVQSSSTTTIVIVVVIILVAFIGICLAAFVKTKLAKQRAQNQRDVLSSPLLDAAEARIFKRYHSGEWEWTPIKDLSVNPVLYEGGGPAVSDVQQDLEVQDDSWFLAALNSLCVAYGENKWPQFDQIFKDVRSEDLKGKAQIPIKLWRYGEWKTILIEPTLPTKKGKLCFVHSKNKNVFWSALLQKAYAQEYIAYKHLVAERDVHVLEDLTGGIVNKFDTKFYRHEHRKIWHLLGNWGSKAICITCKTLEEDKRMTFYSVKGIDEPAGLVHLREFVEKHERAANRSKPIPHITVEMHATRISRSGDENEEDEIFLPSDKLADGLDEIDMLFNPTNQVAVSEVSVYNGTWKQTTVGSDFKNDDFWTNPQYLLSYDQSMIKGKRMVHICVALMQKDTADSTTQLGKELPDPMKIGLTLFRITSNADPPKHALEHFETGTRDSWTVAPHFTREACGWWKVPTVDRYIVVPYASGGNKSSAEFLLRYFSQRPEAATLQELPRNVQEESTTSNGQGKGSLKRFYTGD